MQLKSKTFTNISMTLAAATCVLTAPVTAQPSEFDSWDVDAGLLIYAESDHQVQAYEGALSLTKQIDDERSINLKGIIDVLTGASPNGAVAQNKAKHLPVRQVMAVTLRLQVILRLMILFMIRGLH